MPQPAVAIGPVVDYGTIADFDDRWAWITQKQLPAYKLWSDANQGIDVQRLLNGGYKKRWGCACVTR